MFFARKGIEHPAYTRYYIEVNVDNINFLGFRVAFIKFCNLVIKY